MARLELAPTARTIPAALDDAIARRTGATALRGRWSAYTFAELGAVVRREAGALATLGVRRHTVVAASLPDHPDIVVLFLACMRLGAVWSGVDRRLDASDKARALRSARASVYLAEPDALAQLRGHTTTLREAVLVNPTTFADHGLLGDEVYLDSVEAAPVDRTDRAALDLTAPANGCVDGVAWSHGDVLESPVPVVTGEPLTAVTAMVRACRSLLGGTAVNCSA